MDIINKESVACSTDSYILQLFDVISALSAVCVD